MSRNYYMVRAMDSSAERLALFTDKDIVAVGWSSMDFSAHTDEQALRDDLWQQFYSKGSHAPTQVGKYICQAARFWGIKEGDYIVVPYGDKVILGVATGEKLYCPEDGRLDLANQQMVKFQRKADGSPKTIARNELYEGLQRRLRMRGSKVVDLWSFAEHIEKMFAGDDYTYVEVFSEKENALCDAFKETLLARIRDGDTNLQAGGIGLEQLVKELFECEGYSARVLGKRSFEGKADADVLAEKDDIIWGEQNIFAQIKHHRGETGDYGLQQLIDLKINEKVYNGQQLMLITSADFGEDLIAQANDKGVIIMDGSALIDWVFERRNHLCDNTRRKLGISTVPQIV